MNVGAIVEDADAEGAAGALARRGPGSTGALGRGGRMLGEVEEYFIEGLVLGRHLCVRRRGACASKALAGRSTCYVSRASDKDAEDAVLYGRQVPALHLSGRAGAHICCADGAPGTRCRTQVREWLELQRDRSASPARDEMLVETFPRGDKHYLVCLSVRGAARASDARHAADAAAGARAAAAARLRRQRICAGGVGLGDMSS